MIIPPTDEFIELPTNCMSASNIRISSAMYRTSTFACVSDSWIFVYTNPDIRPSIPRISFTPSSTRTLTRSGSMCPSPLNSQASTSSMFRSVSTRASAEFPYFSTVAATSARRSSIYLTSPSTDPSNLVQSPCKVYELFTDSSPLQPS